MWFSAVARAADLRLLAGLWGEDAWRHTGHGGNSGVYRPLALATLVGESLVHHGAAWALHLTNVLLHVATTVLLGALLAALVQGARPRAAAPPGPWVSLAPWCAAAVFGVHPLHTEAVDSIFNRSEILATLGVVGALWAVWAHRRARPLLAWGLAAGCYLVALFSKESGVTLPLLVVLVVGLLAPEPWRQRARSLAPVVTLAAPLALYLSMRERAIPWPALGASRLEVYLGTETWAQRLRVVASTTFDAWKLLVWPHPLRCFYEVGEGRGLALTVPVHAAIVGVAVALRRFPALLAGVLGFYAAILPSTRLVTDLSRVVQEFGERYVYLPSALLAVPLAFGLARLADRWGPRALLATTAVLCALLGALTFARNRDWHGNVALFSAECAVDPDGPRGTIALARAFLAAPPAPAGPAFCRRYLARHPERVEVSEICGQIYERAGLAADEEATLRRLWAYEGSARALLALARAHDRAGDRALAALEFEIALAGGLDPSARHLRLGEAIARRLPARREAARAEFVAADPSSGVAREWIRRLDAGAELPP